MRNDSNNVRLESATLLYSDSAIVRVSTFVCADISKSNMSNKIECLFFDF